ncbi:MAG: hypothetical protein K8I82_11520 [Anaerolineae bacterium]|nr:hypothetical protein [Anaerolineae bacterium]
MKHAEAEMNANNIPDEESMSANDHSGDAQEENVLDEKNVDETEDFISSEPVYGVSSVQDLLKGLGAGDIIQHQADLISKGVFSSLPDPSKVFEQVTKLTSTRDVVQKILDANNLRLADASAMWRKTLDVISPSNAMETEARKLAEYYKNNILRNPIEDALLSISKTLESPYKNVFESITWPIWKNALAPFIQVQYDFMATLDRITADTILGESKILFENFNWWVVPGLPFEFYHELSDLLDVTPQSKEVDEHFCRWTKENNFELLNSLIGKWSHPYFDKWSKAVTEAFNVHKQGFYYASVPLLILIFDGIAVEYIEQELSGLSVGSARGAFDMWFEQGTSATREAKKVYLEIMADILTNRFFKTMYDTPPYLNRHRIMHGRDRQFGTEANSVRGFFLLQSLHYALTHLPLKK